jgi:hypothetical protein
MAIVKVQELTVPAAGAATAGFLVGARGRKGKPVAQTLRPASRAALGADKAAYFEAEFNGYVWRIGRRVAEPAIPW